MNISLAFILLLAGVSGNGDGIAFQAQLGYELALLFKGEDYVRQPKYPAFVFFDPSMILYMSNAIRGRMGILVGNRFEIRGTGSIAYCKIADPGSGLDVPLDSMRVWYYPPHHNYNRLRTIEYSGGVEIGYKPRNWRHNGDIYLGLEGIWGRFHCRETWSSYRADDEDELVRDDTIHFISSVKGLGGHLGVAVPVASFGRFSVQLHSMLKGGAVREQSAELVDAPAGTQWEGPRTLLKWGVALGLTLNYKGGQQ
jgi:hypothetical protein